MSYVSEIDVVKGDKLYDIYMQCQDSSGTAAVLTGYSQIRLRVFQAGASSCLIDTTSNITVDTASEGKIHYQVQAADFDTIELYDVEIQVTYTSGKIITFRGLTITVTEEAP